MRESIIGKCRLQEILYNKRMSQIDLSAKAGIDSSLISKYANNKKKMSIETLYIIAKALNCRMEDLYYWKE